MAFMGATNPAFTGILNNIRSQASTATAQNPQPGFDALSTYITQVLDNPSSQVDASTAWKLIAQFANSASNGTQGLSDGINLLSTASQDGIINQMDIGGFQQPSGNQPWGSNAYQPSTAYTGASNFGFQQNGSTFNQFGSGTTDQNYTFTLGNFLNSPNVNPNIKSTVGNNYGYFASNPSALATALLKDISFDGIPNGLG